MDNTNNMAMEMPILTFVRRPGIFEATLAGRMNERGYTILAPKGAHRTAKKQGRNVVLVDYEQTPDEQRRPSTARIAIASPTQFEHVIPLDGRMEAWHVHVSETYSLNIDESLTDSAIIATEIEQLWAEHQQRKVSALTAELEGVGWGYISTICEAVPVYNDGISRVGECSVEIVLSAYEGKGVRVGLEPAGIELTAPQVQNLTDALQRVAEKLESIENSEQETRVRV